ncbi:hexitol phosphatase HxpB [Danxiaibacter flavus]|uniref:Hexitol phosphatase HxpB n=1 Tax=Danxiaibacter flavus TaxID=3049108 RepID=A0ABV3ZDW8_9BACT|nr:hexitol phosphatase HxpB [Chitinophagaceae bacterium DXS]
MHLNTVIFDMDGLLIDSEPLWEEAASEVFNIYGVNLTEEQYKTTTGLRTKEFVQWWFRHFNIGEEELIKAEKNIFSLVLDKIGQRGQVMPGVDHIFEFFSKLNFKIGIASSSPDTLIQMVIDQIGIRKYIQATASAEFLAYGKPHPQVYLDCAAAIQSNPTECVCFEDSFNGMIAAKSARMKCVVVPHHAQYKEERWGASDLKLSSLQNFGALHLSLLG